MQVLNTERTCLDCPAARLLGKLDVCACGLTDNIHDDSNNFGQVIECSRQPELGMFEPSLSVERCSEWQRMNSQ